MNNYFRQLVCKHEWKYVGDLSASRGIRIRVYHCKKCGKFREESVIE